MMKPLLGLSALSVALAVAMLPAPAFARGRVISVQGANGHGLVSARSIERQPGSFSADRSVQTNSGRGYRASLDRSYAPGEASSTRSIQANDGRGAITTRDAQWGDGSYTGGRQTTTNSGKTFGRATTATANGDGTASYATTLTGPQGKTTTVNGTLSHNP